jgi:hypothetical protein
MVAIRPIRREFSPLLLIVVGLLFPGFNDTPKAHETAFSSSHARGKLEMGDRI